jgi:hypothetical protein
MGIDQLLVGSNKWRSGSFPLGRKQIIPAKAEYAKVCPSVSWKTYQITQAADEFRDHHCAPCSNSPSKHVQKKHPFQAVFQNLMPPKNSFGAKSVEFRKIRENLDQTQLASERNREIVKTQNSAPFTDNSMTLPEIRHVDFQANTLRNWLNYPETDH